MQPWRTPAPLTVDGWWRCGRCHFQLLFTARPSFAGWPPGRCCCWAWHGDTVKSMLRKCGMLLWPSMNACHRLARGALQGFSGWTSRHCCMVLMALERSRHQMKLQISREMHPHRAAGLVAELQ